MSRENQTREESRDVVASHTRQPQRRNAACGGTLWRRWLPCPYGPLGQRCADHGVDRVEPPGHAFAQQQGKADTARLSSQIWPRSIVSSGADDLGAKQFVLRGVLRDIERARFDDHRSFFSCRFR